MSARENRLECIVGSDSLERVPRIGSVITVKHSGSYSNGLLRNAFYWKDQSEMKCTNITDNSKELVLILSIVSTISFNMQIGPSQTTAKCFSII